jgi:hypothetical protein
MRSHVEQRNRHEAEEQTLRTPLGLSLYTTANHLPQIFPTIKASASKAVGSGLMSCAENTLSFVGRVRSSVGAGPVPVRPKPWPSLSQKRKG